jgi:alkane 1-monooxygenase
MNCLRFSITTFVYFPLACVGVLYAEYWAAVALLAIFVIQLIVDNSVKQPERTSGTGYYQPAVCILLLYLHLPFTIILLLFLAWQVAPGDLLHLGEIVGNQIQPPHQSASLFEILSCSLLAGYLLSSNTIVAHEFVHHRRSQPGYAFGRILLIINCDSQFSTSHVYGHHRDVCTHADPATARRGENLYSFAIRSTIGQYAQALRIQQAHMAKKGKRFFSIGNELLRGISLSLLVIIILAINLPAMVLVAYLIAIAFGKFLFEAVNYIQHYGLVRIRGAAVQDRHSWDCCREGTAIVHYALTRHSHHHREPAARFWNLTTNRQTILSNHLKYGYLAAIVAAMIPPLWFRIVTPVIKAWDDKVASTDERLLTDNLELSPE